MPVSLKTMLKHLEYDRKISRAEYEALVEKLKGHDRQIYKKAIEDCAYIFSGIIDCFDCPVGCYDCNSCKDAIILYLKEQLKEGASNKEM